MITSALTNKQLYRSVEDQLPLFYKSYWLDAVCYSDWDVAVVEENNQVWGVWPYRMERKLGIGLIRNPLLTPYLGPFLLLGDMPDDMARWDMEDRLLKVLLQQLPDNGYLQFTTIPGFRNFLPFLHQGIKNTLRITYHIDLHLPVDTLLDNMQKRRRRYLRNGDTSIRVVDAEPYMPALLRMHRATFTEKNTPYPYPEDFIRKLVTDPDIRKHAAFWAVLNAAEEPVAMLWVVSDGTTMYQLLSAYTRQNEYPAAFSLLTWHAILHARSMGLKIFDFEGSVHPGIEPFFRRFGGVRVPYLYYEKQSSWLWALKRKLLG